jgi:acyl-CoA synthetase (AMP-forming)/AMP-acid ligase II
MDSKPDPDPESERGVAVSGGASLPEDILRTFEDKFGIEVLEGYGMTETASSCSFNRPGETKVLSIGKPMWGSGCGWLIRRAGRCRRAASTWARSSSAGTT